MATVRRPPPRNGTTSLYRRDSPPLVIRVTHEQLVAMRLLSEARGISRSELARQGIDVLIDAAIAAGEIDADELKAVAEVERAAWEEERRAS